MNKIRNILFGLFTIFFCGTINCYAMTDTILNNNNLISEVPMFTTFQINCSADQNLESFTKQIDMAAHNAGYSERGNEKHDASYFKYYDGKNSDTIYIFYDKDKNTILAPKTIDESLSDFAANQNSNSQSEKNINISYVGLDQETFAEYYNEHSILMDVLSNFKAEHEIATQLIAEIKAEQTLVSELKKEDIETIGVLKEDIQQIDSYLNLFEFKGDIILDIFDVITIAACSDYLDQHYGTNDYNLLSTLNEENKELKDELNKKVNERKEEQAKLNEDYNAALDMKHSMENDLNQKKDSIDDMIKTHTNNNDTHSEQPQIIDTVKPQKNESLDNNSTPNTNQNSNNKNNTPIKSSQGSNKKK